MNTIDLQRDAPYPGVTEMHGLVRSLGPTTLLDLFESHAVPEEDRFGLIEEALALLIVEGRREADLRERFLETLEARCRIHAASQAVEDGDGGDRSGFELIGRVEYLCQASQEEVFHDPQRAVSLAERAVELADRIDPRICGEAAATEQRILARAWLGNARRVASDYLGAERAFRASERLIGHMAPPARLCDADWISGSAVESERGTSGIYVLAQVFSLKASLLIDQQRPAEARAFLDTLLAYHRRAGDSQAIACIHMKRSLVATYLGEWEQAIEELDQARAELDPERDEQLYALALQNSVDALLEAGNTAEARRGFDDLPPANNRWMELRRLWIEGNLLRAEKAYGAARVAYDSARNGYAEDENHYYAGLVSLDLAALALDRGGPVEAFEIAQEASVLLVRGAARQDPLAALRLLLTALEHGVADRAFVLNVARRIASYKPAR